MKIAAFFLVFTAIILAQEDSVYTSFSGFYTGGQVEPGRASNSYSGYLTLGYGAAGITGGYDNLKIDSVGWDYTQKSYVIAPYYYFGSFFVKAAYMGISGDFNLYPSSTGGVTYNFATDKTKIYSFELGNFGYYYTAGLGYTHSKLTGYKHLFVDQYTARYQFVPDYRWLFGVRPTHTSTTDGRKYFSCMFRANYLVIPYLVAKASVNIGNRMYYFDNDLLTVFNQDQTQNKNFGLELDYYMGKFVLQGAWQYNEFEKQPTRYFILGVKYGTYIGF